MSDYKLVPVEPTAEMVGAAEDAYMPFGDMELAIRMAVLAAPSVQGEPVGWVNSDELDNMLDDRTATLFPVRTGFHGKPLYAAPQPAEQQPCPEDIREGAPYDDPAFESLCREHEVSGTAAAAQCAVFWEAGKRVAEQKAATDVAELVEALSESLKSIEIPAVLTEIRREFFKSGVYAAVSQLNTVLAARRKGGEK